ncbi:MAG: leucine-rich repeat domain-containing protein, partial [Gemmatimonadota bacterium]
MNLRPLLLLMGSLLLPLGCGDNDDSIGPAEPLVLEPSEFCSDYPDTAIATFEDGNLEAAIRTALSVGAQDHLTCGLISGLTELNASSRGITSLMGVQNLTGLTSLGLRYNSISDISALSGLTSLTYLDLTQNSISGIGPLSELTSLTELYLYSNSISDIRALSGLTSL